MTPARLASEPSASTPRGGCAASPTASISAVPRGPPSTSASPCSPPPPSPPCPARRARAPPPPSRFAHLDDWLAPELARGARDIGAEFLDPTASHWTPIGTPEEYLAANLQPVRLSYWDGDARARASGVRFPGNSVLGRGARLGPGARLQRAVVWDGERVPRGLCVRDGVFAGGRYHRHGKDEPK